ncbi:MAG: hypothetical protein GX462_00260 [Thermotogaceae bacterium]|nr:hypothetical protein [Thermotogaceae bacterium]
MSWQLLSVGFSKVDLVSAFLMALETLHANCVEADTILAVSELQWDQAGVVIINGERLAQPPERARLSELQSSTRKKIVIIDQAQNTVPDDAQLTVFKPSIVYRDSLTEMFEPIVFHYILSCLQYPKSDSTGSLSLSAASKEKMRQSIAELIHERETPDTDGRRNSDFYLKPKVFDCFIDQSPQTVASWERTLTLTELVRQMDGYFIDPLPFADTGDRHLRVQEDDEPFLINVRRTLFLWGFVYWTFLEGTELQAEDVYISKTTYEDRLFLVFSLSISGQEVEFYRERDLQRWPLIRSPGIVIQHELFLSESTLFISSAQSGAVRLSVWTPAKKVVTEKAPPADIRNALTLLDDDTDELKELIRVAMRYLPEHLDAIGKSIIEQNGEQLGKAAHKIKGSFTSFAAKRCIELAVEMERAAGENDFVRAKPTFNTLKVETDRLIEYLRQFL